MSERKFDENKLVSTRYRPIHKKYEMISRMAAEGHRTISGQIEELIFNHQRFPWQKILEKLREKHRKLGIDDREFYHPVIRKKMGLSARPGPRAKNFFIE